MEPRPEEKELIEKFEKNILKEKEIVNLFNSLNEATFGDYNPELEIQNDEKLIIFELLGNSLYFLEQSANEEDNKNCEILLLINVFKALFIDKNTFNMDNLENKKCFFNLALKLFSAQDLTDTEIKIITDEISKYSLFNNIAMDFDLNYFYSYCLYLIFQYSTSKLFFIDSFISFMKKVFKDEHENVDLEIRKDESITDTELNKIAQSDLLNSLNNIYYQEENYYMLCVTGNKLEKKPLPPLETEEKIQYNPVSKSKRKRKKKKKIEQNNNEINIENKAKEENEIQKIKKEEKGKLEIKSGDDSINKDNNKNKEKEEAQKKKDNQKTELQKNGKTEIKLQYPDNKPKVSNSEEEKNQSLIDKLFDQIEELKRANDELKEKVNELEEKDLQKTEQIELLKNEDLQKTKQIDEMKETITKHSKRHKNTRKDLIEVKKNSIKLNTELRLIQLRDVFKNIIDLFCSAYNLRQDGYYSDKVLDIILKINKQGMKEDEKIKLKKFFEKIHSHLKFSNENAHNIDSSISIIEQVFIYIDPQNELDDVKIKFKAGTIDDSLKSLSNNRLNNFNNKTKFRMEEEKIINSAKISEIYPSIKNNIISSKSK